MNANVVLLPLRDGEREPELELESALAWFERVSRGKWSARCERLAVRSLPSDASSCTKRGGLGAWPDNSQRVVEEALRELDDPAREALTAADERVVVVASGPWRPHTWNLRGGGLHLGRGAWMRSYSLLPDRAGLAVIAHELGHLLFGWSDAAPSTQLGRHCLMARGALVDADREPAPPCAPLRIARGWCELVPLDASTPLARLGGAAVGEFVLGDIKRWFERRDHDGGTTLLVHELDSRGALRRSRALELEPKDLARPVLALVPELASARAC